MPIRPRLDNVRPFIQAMVSSFAALLLLSIVSSGFVRAQQTSTAGFRAFSLRHIRADDAAARTRNTLSDFGLGSEVLVDRTRNRLLLRGDANANKLVAQLLQTIDQPGVDPARDGPEPNQVVGYPVSGQPLDVVAAQLREQYAPSTGVRIATDPRSQQLIVMAPPSIQREIAERFTTNLGQPAGRAADAPPQQRGPQPGPGHRLQNISWRELEDDLRRVWRGTVHVIVDGSGEGEIATAIMDSIPVLRIDRRHNHVTFPGTEEASKTWRQVVQALDYRRDRTDQQTHLVSLRNAEPANVQTAVALLQAASREIRPSGTPPHWGGRLVSMIFQAQNGQQPAAGGQQPAGNQPAAGDPADAPEGDEPDEGTGLIGDVQIEILEPLGSIIIRGHPRDVARIQKIIDEIEKIAEETRPVTEVYYLKHINGNSLATLLTELYEETYEARQGPLTIRALYDPNAVLLIGSLNAVTAIRELIEQLDQPMDVTGRFIILRLKHISALDAEQTVRNFFVTTPGTATDPRPGIGTQVRIIADYRSNSLIVQASPRDLAEVQRLVTSIDVDGKDLGTSEVRVFRLRNALSDELAAVLQAAISGQPVQGAGGGAGGVPGQPGQPAGGGATQSQANVPSKPLELMVIDGESKQLLRSGILSDALVTSNPSINALVVRAPSESMELIGALIAQLDQLPDAQSVLKVFTVANGDATNLAGMLQQLFGQQVTAGQGNAQLFGGFGGFGQQQLQAVTAGGDTSLVPLRFAVDVRTNSILVSGSTGDLEVVEAVLFRLDEEDIETRRTTVVRLQNAPAEDVALAITSFLTSQQQLFQQLLVFNQAISPFEQIEREVIVVPEIVTNSLIVSATPRYFDSVMQIVRDLDFRPPMVLVQVLIAEVELDDTFEFGIELGLQDSLLFNRGNAAINNASVPGFNFNQAGLPNLSDASRENLAAQSLSTFALGRSGSTGYGGMVISAANESVSILIRALQDAGRLQILSRPQITTLNNQEAFIQVGKDVSRITGTTVTQGIVQNNIEDVQTGLILRVTPLINDDGIIVMDLSVERSGLGDESEGTPVGTDVNGGLIRSPPINRTTAQTVISAKSGQTVVFAGLISKKKILDLRRIPWLSDIPYLGKLFEYEKATEDRNELLIVMTPHIVSSDDDYEFIKAMETQRMSYCLADVIEVHGDVGLQGGGDIFCSPAPPVIFPHLDPTASGFLSAQSSQDRQSELAGPRLEASEQPGIVLPAIPPSDTSGFPVDQSISPLGRSNGGMNYYYNAPTGDVQRRANYSVGRPTPAAGAPPLHRLPQTRR